MAKGFFKQRKLKIGLVQMSMIASKEKNLSKACSLIRKAAKEGAQIVCLPELFSTLYFPQAKKDKKARLFAEHSKGETSKVMASLAKELGIAIIVPFYEKAGGKYYNSLSVFDENGKLLGTYRKMHLPYDPLFYEKNYFSRGDKGYKVFKTKYARISALICFDQWFPEAARICALKGAEIIFYPTAIGNVAGRKIACDKDSDDWLSAWLIVQRGHAISNSVHVAAVNRVGREGNLNFWGNSFVCGPFGKILARASGKKEEVVVVEIDLSENKRINEGWGFLRNRRPKSYGAIAK